MHALSLKLVRVAAEIELGKLPASVSLEPLESLSLL
jgi:hypothetical protein